MVNFFKAMIPGIILLAIGLALDPGYDDTDDVENGDRSGMALYTDHQTGCQYLGRFFGALTPRVDGNGNHLGCR